jgi:hypothetical protein
MTSSPIARGARVLSCFFIGMTAWLSALGWFYGRDLRAASAEAHQPLLRAALDRLDDDAADEKARATLRTTNPEWDFMSRTFLVLSLANLALAEPERKTEHLAVMDRVIDRTLADEREGGLYHFLLPYARAKSFVLDPPRSQFVDGEVALMLGVRRLVGEKPEYRRLFRERVELVEKRMRASPVFCAESYPDECWTFCNSIALAALKLADVLDGADHDEFFRQYVQTARARLVEPETGMLVSSFRVGGEFLDGPEGSSIWLSAHMLELVDREFSRDQFLRAKRHLARSLFGFGWAAEWPRTWPGPSDVDSGPVLPLLDASAGSSGLALVGARAFGDFEFYDELSRSLRLGAFPIERGGRLRYAAAGPIGDSVILYSAVAGPLWRKIEGLGAAKTAGGAS